MEFIFVMFRQALERIFTGDIDVWTTLVRTLELALASTALALLIGLPIAVWLTERPTTVRRAGIVMANAGLGLPPVVLGIYLAVSFYPASPLGRLELTNTMTAMVIAQAMLALPIVIAISAAAIAGLPFGLIDQARAFGASRGARGVLAVREARVGIFAAVMAALLSALAEVGAVILVGGNIEGHTNTLASTVLLDLSASDPAGATANVLVLLLLVLVVGAALTFAQQRAAR
ncbi:ABC transporter permease [Solirubrobacter soli]|uniref:ABC transporter permease n=1 Tax=Solirubrobacter soli TaxID=363832 RepID=UPI00041B360B|nr:ABC transporter permease [Solirubrobacter soli]